MRSKQEKKNTSMNLSIKPEVGANQEELLEKLNGDFQMDS